MKYKYLIYDFDGTISDSYPCFTESLLELLHQYGLDDTYAGAYAKLKVSVGHALKSYRLPDDYGTVSARFKEIHDRIAYTGQKPLPGAAEILKAAVGSGRQNFLYTHSGKLPTELMRNWGILEYFTDIIDSTCGFPRKPAPDALNYLCDKHGLEKPLCLMIGDRDLDVECAANAGMAGCLYDYEHYYDSAVCDYRITDLLELEKIF